MPKRTIKNKQKYSLDQETRRGMELLRHLDDVIDLGTAILSHDLETISKIDSDAARQRRQNAEEYEWERNKKQEAKDSGDIEQLINDSRNSILGTLAEATSPFGGGVGYEADAYNTADAEKVGRAYGHIMAKDIPGTPENYKASDFLKDQWNSFFGEMNTLQAEDARGYQVRSQNDRSLIGDYLHSLDTLDEIDNIDGELEQINNALGLGGLSIEDRLSLRGRSASLIQQKNALLAEYESLAPKRKLLEDTVNQSGVGAAWDDLMSGNGIFGGNWANPAGKVTAAHDELNDARRFIYDLGKGTRNRKETRQMLNRALLEYDKLNEGWNAVIEENERDAKYHKDKISNWFQARADRTGINFTDPDTYLFKMPGIIGGSSSSYMKLIPAMLSSILGYAAANVATGGGALLATALGAAGSFAMNRAAGISENNAEVALATKEKIKAKTDLTDEDIDKLVAGKLDDPKKLRAITENIKDVENLFNQDMAATTWDAAIDAALGAVPVGAIAKMNRFVRGTKAWRKAVTNPTMKKILRSKFGEDVVKGWEAGSLASPLVGAGAAAANATVGRYVKTLAKIHKDIIVRAADHTLYGALAHDMAKEMSLLGKTAKALDLDKIATNQALKKGLGALYMKDITGKVIKSTIAEGIEEGKQHANAEAYKNSYQNNPELNSTFDIALTDALNGLTMGSYVLGIPLDGLGIINIKDQDLLQEIKGGMLGGWGQTAMVNVALNIVPYISQQKAADIITEQIFNNKLYSTAQRDQYRQWLSKGLFKPGHQDILNSFDRLRKINEEYQLTNGLVGIAPQQIDEAQLKYERIISLAKDPLMRLSAEDQGINVRTKNNPLTWKSNSQYHDYVATVATAMDRVQEITQNRNEAAVNLNLVRLQIQTNLSISDEGLGEILNALQSNEDLDNFTDRLNNIESVVDTVSAEGQSDFEYTDVVAQLAALLTYRDLIEQGLKLQQDNPSAKVRRGLKSQLDKLNKDIDELIKVNEDKFVHLLGISIGKDFKTGEDLQLFKNAKQNLKTLADVEDHLAYNEEAHEQLKEAYLDLIKWNNELDSANKSFENLVGKREQDENGEMHYVGGNAVNIMKNIQRIKDADDAFEQSVEQVFQEDLKAQHLDEENAWREQEIEPRIKKPVLNSKGEQIQVQRSLDGYINRRLADNETVDDMGYLWRYEDGNSDDPLNRIDRGAITPTGNAEQDRRAFRDAWANITGTQLPLTPEGMIERRQRTLFEEARKNGWPEPAPEPEKRIDYKSLVESYYERRNRLVPPSTPPTPPTPPIVHNDDPQQDVLDMLEAKYEEDKKVVQNDPDGYETTSQDYFIENDGKIVRASRVHNVKPESYNHLDQNKQIEDIYNRFKEAKSLKDVEDIMIEYVDPNPDLFTEIHVYHLYIQDNLNVFFDNLTSDSTKEYQTTIKNLSQAIVNNLHKAGVSVKVGNVVDELLRNFFGSFEFADYTQTEEGIEKIFNEWTTESDGRTYKEIFKGNIEAFKNLIHDLQNQYDYYTKTLGWKLSTLPFTWKARFNELGWVAGQTDMIGVDKEGKIHIIDFKTSKYTFWNAYPPNMLLTSTYQSDLGILTEDDFYTDSGRLSRKARNVLRAIKDDNKNAKIDLEWQNGRAVVVNKIRPFVSLPNAQYGQQLSSYEDYSNQLTAYAEMLKAEGFDVASIEILPIKVQYDYEFTEAGKGLNSATLEPRVFLTFSSKMLSILDGIESRDDQALLNVKEDLHNSIGHIDYKLSQLEEKITDDVFNELSEQGKLLYSDFVTRVNNIVAEVNQTLYNPNFKDDIDVYRSQLSEADKLLEEFDQFLRDLRADYSQARLKATQLAENEAKRDLQKKREQQAGPAVGTVQAPNKRDSQGNVSHTNINYQRINGDRELALATIAPNFIDDADITLYIDGDDIYCDISFEGKTWQRVLIDSKYNNTWMPNGKKLYDTIKQLQSEAKPGEKIVPVKATMYRTNGRINLAVDKNGKLTYNDVRNTDLFAGLNIYDIEFSAAYGSLGFVDNNGQIVTFDTSETDRKPIGQWSNIKMASLQGTLIYKKRMPKNERSNSEVYVAIDRVKMSPNDADFIVEALKNPTQLDRPYFKEINGTSYNLHATPRQIINLMIPIVDDPQRLGNFDSIIRDPNNQNVVYIMKRQDLAANTTGRGRFDLSVDADIARFKAELQSMSIAERHDVLMSRLGSFDSAEGALPFGGIRQFFVEQNGAITSLDITDTIKFDLEDFKVVKSPSGVTRQGVNGFAYYLKHGMLRTQYANMGGANVEIKDAMIDRGQPVDVSVNGIQSVPNVPESTPIGSVSTVIDTSSVDDLFKIADPSKKTKPISEDKARKHIAEILGEHVPVEFQSTFIKVASGAAHVVGNCKADAIVLSSYAWPGVEYHEAFHRVFELLLPSHERDAIYQKIAKRIGVELYQDGKENKQAFREVAEYAADHYMEHMQHHITDLKIPFLTKIYNKIHDWVSMLWHWSDRDLYKTFIKVNDGKYKNAIPSKKAIERFNRLYNELYCQIHGIDFEHIVNRPMYDKLRQNVMFCILYGQNVDPSGRNIQEIGKHIDKETFLAGAERLKKGGIDIFGDTTDIPTVGQLAMKEIYDNFDNEVLRDDIANDISVLSTDFVKQIEEDSTEDAQSDDVTNASIGEHTRSSYEFSRFSKTSSRVRFFFATIPDTKYEKVKEIGQDGKPVVKQKEVLALNEFGLPLYAPVGVVFNEFLNFFHDIDTISELKARLEYLAKEDPLYSRLYKAIDKIDKSVYTVKDGVMTRNSDQEALLVQLMNIIRSNKHNFDIARSTSYNNGNGLLRINIQTTDADYNATFYPTQWNQMLVNGGTPVIKVSQDGSLKFNPAIKGVEFTFLKISELFSHGAQIKTAENGSSYTDVGIKEWLSNAVVGGEFNKYLKLKINGKSAYYNNPKNPEQLEVVKDKIVQALNMIGIQFSGDEFNYMLRHKYGSTDYEALSRMFSSTSFLDSMTSFLQFLRDAASNGKLNQEVYIRGKKVKIENAYAKLAFVRELANWKYAYRHAHDQLTVLATGNNKFYEISDNNYISDVTRYINKRSSEFEELKNDPYVFYEGEADVTGVKPVYGSLILKEITENPDTFITLRNFVGFKTDKRGDYGSDYFEISKQEDYVSKATILEQGGIIMPTLSDKKTWVYVDGIKLPGLDYSGTVDDAGNTVAMAAETLGDLFVISADPMSLLDEVLSQKEDVVDRFISYAMSEYQSVKKTDRDLDEMEANGTKGEEVANYYNKEQGAMFSSLLGVWVSTYKNDANGQPIVSGEKFISFNNKENGRTRKDNIKDAEDYFFKQPRDILRALISRLLHKRLLKEIDTCEKLGLIKRVENSNSVFGDYENVGLNNQAIDIIYKSIVLKNGQPKDGIATQRYKSLAVMIYLNDISNKSIMSGQEVERVFSGNPAFYKWIYDSDGNLIDRTVDELKRLGGLVSTGNNNFTELKDVPSKYLDENGNFKGTYVAAEVDNELIESPKIEDIEEQMTYGEISVATYLQEEEKAIKEYRDRRNTLLQEYNKGSELDEDDREFLENSNPKIDELEIREEVSSKIDAMSIEDMKLILSPKALQIAERKAKEATDSYRLKYKNGKIDDGIDVADGGAYITDTMAEMLLRMNGNYSTEIQNAFKILREEVTSNLMQKHLAYQQVVTSVIGSQKYTAFGRRLHKGTGIQVTYYNKMALFPLFKCIATGKMQNVFNKMKSQGIDMLMVNSAVKVGSQGSKPIEWNTYAQNQEEYSTKPSFDESFEFNTYEQKFLYLRKQLNTDPKEESMMSMGTQMTKVVMSCLFDGRDYVMQDGSTMKGSELRNDIMNAINTLSDRGYHNIVTRFFKTDSKGNVIDKDGNIIPDNSRYKILDEVKFAKEVKNMMQTKDPDRNIIDALEIVELKNNDGTTSKHLRLPLNAISNSTWMESVLVSSINKKVVDIETPGAAFIQRSIWAMEGSSMYDKTSIQGDTDLPLWINGGRRLQMINEEGSMDCVLSLDFFKKMFKGELPVVPIRDKNRNLIWDLIPETDKNGKVKLDENGKIVYKLKRDKDGNPILDKDGKPVYKRKIRTREMSFDETRNWLINRGIIGPNATANIIGYRIPTQAESSIHALRCVDILPVVNDTVILPAEFTKITGSDFDIDKLFLSSIQYKVSREEGEDGKFHQTVSDAFSESTSAYYQNKLIKDYLALLLDWKSIDEKKPRTTNILHRSIDNDTKLLKDIIKDIERGKPANVEEPYAFYSLSAQTESKNDYITGKIGIGPFALNNNNHILTMMYHVRFKHIESSIMSELGLESLDNREDKDGESIMSWISALINAHVDIAKDPYISRLNVNPFTYNLVNLLVRTGLGKKTFYFTSQPVMRALAEAYINAGSLYMSDPHKGKFKLQQEAIDETADKWFKDLGEDALNRIKAVKEGGVKNANVRENVNKEIRELFESGRLEKAAKSNDYSMQDQLLVYLAYLQFDKYANALSNLVKYSKIDTKKHGKNIVEQMIYEKGYAKTFDTRREDNLFDPIGLDAMQHDSYIATKTSNAIGSVRDILSSQFIQSTPAFQGSVDVILEAIGRTESLSTTLVTKVCNALSAAIKSKFFVDEYLPLITTNPNYMHDLVSESQEYLDFSVDKQGYVINVNGDIVHDLTSYCQGTSYVIYQGKPYPVKIKAADNNAKTLTLDKPISKISGKILLKNGRNTIYDRFMKLQTDIANNSDYAQLRSESGDINNKLLSMIVPGTTTEYKPAYVVGETPDTYETSKFIKLFNFVEDSGNTANYIIDGWEELLSYTDPAHPEAEKTIREFARDLIVYAFITSGDRGGFTKMFKYVPTSWREESGYGQFIYNKLLQYQVGTETDIDISDVILNNWYDNEIVPTHYLIDKKSKTSNFMLYKTKVNGVPYGFPTILAALKKDGNNWVPYIEPETAPLYIKIPRRLDRNAENSQRRYTIYKMHKIAIGNNGVKYPVYIKVNPRGNQISGGFMITEYGRSDNMNTPEYTINEEVLSKTYQASDIANHINLVKRSEPIYASIVEGLNRAWNKEQERGNGISVQDIESIQRGTNTANNTQKSNQIIVDNTNTINIFAGTHENEELSNLAVRPFVFGNIKFNSVEHAFLFAKLQYLSRYISLYLDNTNKQTIDNVISKIKANMDRILNTTNPYDARNIGNEKITSRSNTVREAIDFYFNDLSTTSRDTWPGLSKLAMKRLIKASFELNPQALSRLLQTGNSLLTHKLGGKWAEEFPRILMEVRQELANKQNNNFDDSLFSDDAMNHCKS